MAPLIYNDDYLDLVTRDSEKLKKSSSDNYYNPSSASSSTGTWTFEERRQILEYQRAHKMHNPEVTMIHGSVLLQNPSKLGQDLWVIYEQVCIASLHLGGVSWSAYCIEKLAGRFPTSKRVKRIYALYRESVGEWEEATTIYRDILRDTPENTYTRKRAIAMKRQQGLVSDAANTSMAYLGSFGTDKEVWHELSQLYLEAARLPQALFCFEDLLLEDPRNLYYVITYAELLFSLAQCFEHYELSRKYFCLALHLDDTNLRALWGLFFCSCQLYKRDQGAEKILSLQIMCVNRIKKWYRKSGDGLLSTEIMLEVLDSELKGCEEGIRKKKAVEDGA